MIAVKIPRDGQEVRTNGVMPDAVAGRPRTNERVGRKILRLRGIARKEKCEPVHCQMVALVDVPERVHASMKIRGMAAKVTWNCEMTRLQTLLMLTLQVLVPVALSAQTAEQQRFVSIGGGYHSQTCNWSGCRPDYGEYKAAAPLLVITVGDNRGERLILSGEVTIAWND
jgi:hypothetical protein